MKKHIFLKPICLLVSFACIFSLSNISLATSKFSNNFTQVESDIEDTSATETASRKPKISSNKSEPKISYRNSEPKLSTSPSFLYQGPTDFLPKDITVNPKDNIRDRISKKDLELSVSAPSVVENTPGQFSIEVSLVNHTEAPLTDINVKLALHDDEDLSLIPPIPDMQNITIYSNKRFAFHLNVDHIDGGNKRFEFCVYAYKDGVIVNPRNSNLVPENFEETQEKTNPPIICFEKDNVLLKNDSEEFNDEQPKNETPISYLINCYTQQVLLNESKPRKAIVVVPGICGSELFSANAQVIDGRQYSTGYRIWPPEGAMDLVDGGCLCGVCNTLNTDSGRLISDLSLISCDDEGKSRANIMPCNPILDCRNNPDDRNFGSANYYKNLVESLANNHSLDDYQLIFFSYDWRSSNGLTAIHLKNFIEEQHLSSVILVAHSMGGLVCSSFVTDPANREKTEKVILLGSPLLGAAKAYGTMEEGKFFDGLIGAAVSPIAYPFVKSLAQTCPSIYESLPPKQIFTNPNSGYIYESNGACGLCTADRYDPIDYDNSVQFINSRNWTPYSGELQRKAQNFHNSLYDQNGKLIIADSDLVDTYNIVGFNSKTLNGFYVKFKNRGRTLKMDSIETNGDATVSLQSSTANNTFAQGQVYYAKNIDHTGLAQQSDCIELIMNIANKHPNVFNPCVIQKYFPGKQIVGDGCLPPIFSCLECD